MGDDGGRQLKRDEKRILGHLFAHHRGSEPMLHGIPSEHIAGELDIPQDRVNAAVWDLRERGYVATQAEADGHAGHAVLTPVGYDSLRAQQQRWKRCALKVLLEVTRIVLAGLAAAFFLWLFGLV